MTILVWNVIGVLMSRCFINETNTDDIAVMVSGNVDDHLAEGREVFNYFDSRGDERINVSQVGDVLRALGQNPTEADIKNCCAQWKEPDHRITFEEFVPIFQTINNSRAVPSIEEFIEGLSHFDKDGNGNINVAELRHLLTTLGERLSDEEADQLLAGHEDSHGNVNIADFVRHVSQR
uniref:Myosin-2 essential light chain n=1 Tax=Panagrellus redivivus TaxID=6233 RepID=A0A7E4VC05_PANRE